ncbi:hypothetical protein JOM56_010104 [Amanita muscaria]
MDGGAVGPQGDMSKRKCRLKERRSGKTALNNRFDGHQIQDFDFSTIPNMDDPSTPAEDLRRRNSRGKSAAWKMAYRELQGTKGPVAYFQGLISSSVYIRENAVFELHASSLR